MNVPKIETANNVTPIAHIDVLGGGQIHMDGTTSYVGLDRLGCLEIVEYSGPLRAPSPSWSEMISRC